MWIRSQDKELLTNASAFSMDGSIENKAWIYDQNGRRLGTYATKERAIEILDEIQKHIEDLNRQIRTDPIYEMPEK